MKRRPAQSLGRSRHHGLSHIAGIAAIVVCGSAMASMLIAGSIVHPEKLGPQTLCRVNAPLTGHSVVLVDGTDRFSPEQAGQVTAAIDREASLLPRYAKLTVLLLSASHPGEPEEVVSICNPGTAREADEWLEGPKKVARLWRTRFRPQVDAAVARLLTMPDADRSPIMETITAVGRRPDFDAGVPNRRLAIVSDLLQLTPGVYTQYRTGDLWGRFARSVLASETTADLRQAVVVIDYIERPSDRRFQGAAHLAFWQRWFKERNAAEIELRMSSPDSQGSVKPEKTANVR